MDPSVAEFYSQIILFLQCIDLRSKFVDPAPNGYEIITHETDPRGALVRFTYNSFNNEIGQEKLNLFDFETGLGNYRVHMGQVGNEILTVLSGDNGDREKCFVLDKKYTDSYCGIHAAMFFELLGANIAKIGCLPGAMRLRNTLFPLDKTQQIEYLTNVTDQFNCQSKLGVFGNKIVFKNKEGDVCKEVNWAANQVWNANTCAEEKYTLNSKNVQLFSMPYLTIKFASGSCKEPTEPSAKYLESTYVKYIFDQNATRNATEEGSEEATNWIAIGAYIGGSLVALSILAGLVFIFIFWCKCRKGRSGKKPKTSPGEAPPNQSSTSADAANKSGKTTPSIADRSGKTTPSITDRSGATTPSTADQAGATTPLTPDQAVLFTALY